MKSKSGDKLSLSDSSATAGGNKANHSIKTPNKSSSKIAIKTHKTQAKPALSATHTATGAGTERKTAERKNTERKTTERKTTERKTHSTVPVIQPFQKREHHSYQKRDRYTHTYSGQFKESLSMFG